LTFSKHNRFGVDVEGLEFNLGFFAFQSGVGEAGLQQNRLGQQRQKVIPSHQNPQLVLTWEGAPRVNLSHHVLKINDTFTSLQL
jgi:hypothetical protein